MNYITDVHSVTIDIWSVPTGETGRVLPYKPQGGHKIELQQ